MFVKIKNPSVLKNKYEKFFKFLIDKEERAKIIKENNSILIILKDFDLRDKSFDFKSFFVLIDKEDNKVYFNTNLANEKNKDIRDFLLRLLENMYKKFESIIDDLDRFFDKLLKNEEFSLEELFFISTATDVFEKIIKENNEVIIKIIENFQIKQGYYLKEDFLQLENEISFLNNNVENLILVYQAYYNMKTSKLLDKISIIAFLFLIPSTIFSMYGMNFQNIPFSDYKYGFLMVSFLSFFIILLLYLFIRKAYNI